jgi:hypothetical protein
MLRGPSSSRGSPSRTRPPVRRRSIRLATASLSLCGDFYTEDFNVENNPGIGTFVWSSEPIQPNPSKTGALIFDVPAEVVGCLEKDGNLALGNFRDDYAFRRPKQLAVIRTYN